MSWTSPWTPVAGTPITADKLREVLASLERKFDGGITGDDLEVTVGGVFHMDADLDLMGHDLVHAANVPTGITNVRSLGVKGDGNADDTKAIESALASIANSGHGLAYFPAGTYKITDTIVVRKTMSIFGAGGSTVFKLYGEPSATIPCFDVKGAATIRDISFTTGLDNSDQIARTCLLLSGDGDVTVDNVVGYNVGALVDVTGGDFHSSTITITDAMSVGCLAGVKGTDQANINISGLLVTGSTGDGIALNGCNQFRISGVGVYGALGTGISLTGCTNGSVTAGVLEAKKDGFLIDSCSQVSLYACHAINSAWEQGGVPYNGITLRSGSGCTIAACHSLVTAAHITSQQYCLLVDGGNAHQVFGNVLFPTQTANNGETDSSSALCFKNNGCTGFLEYGNFPVVL